MRRREFIKVIGGATVGWPLGARAQQADRVRRIGVLQGLAPNDPEYQRRVGELKQGLVDLGWVEGRNIVFEFRYPEGKPDRLPTLAAELVGANVDVIVTQGTESAQTARNATGTIPIVMARSVMPSERASSSAWRDQGATSPASRLSRRSRARSGWN